MHWFELAAKSGHADAQYNLGKMYENGENTERDFTTAYMWFFAAHKQGNKNARKHMKALSEEHKLFPNQMHHAEKSAKEFITP